jgi:hypothetical protein
MEEMYVKDKGKFGHLENGGGMWNRACLDGGFAIIISEFCKLCDEFFEFSRIFCGFWRRWVLLFVD